MVIEQWRHYVAWWDNNIDKLVPSALLDVWFFDEKKAKIY